jgi:hypothetical protein
MLELQTAKPPSPSGWPVRTVDGPARSFLIESERRVVSHCRKLLEDPNLPTEDHRRLTRLLTEAEVRLQGIASRVIQN